MEENEEEDEEEGLKQSVEYICTLIDKELKAGKVPLERIVVGGFSQGCAIALLVGLMSRYAGRLGGVIGLSGYLPLAGKVRKIVEEGREKGGKTKYFLAHGSKDQLVLLAIGDFNCPIYLGIQAHLYIQLINLSPINNKIFSKTNTV